MREVHAITGGAQLEVRSAPTLWWTHVFRKRVTQLRHRILALNIMNAHLFLFILLGLARAAQARRTWGKRTSLPRISDALSFHTGDVRRCSDASASASHGRGYAGGGARARLA